MTDDPERLPHIMAEDDVTRATLAMHRALGTRCRECELAPPEVLVAVPRATTEDYGHWVMCRACGEHVVRLARKSV